MPADPTVGEPMRADLLVLGGGIAGLTAAARVAQDGGSAIVVEKASALGGSGQYASYLWTAATEEKAIGRNPECAPELRTALVEDYDATMSWLETLGLSLGREVRILGFGRGRQIDTGHLIGTCAEIVRDDPAGRVLTRTTPVHMLGSQDRVIGALLRAADGSTTAVQARSTLLATGGFAHDRELRADLLGANGDRLMPRAAHGCVGDGLRLGRTMGADHGLEGAGFYGHLMPSRVVVREPAELQDFTFFHSEHAVLINLQSERFCDETLGDHLTALALAAQPEARALMICDARVHEQWMLRPYISTSQPVDKFARAYKAGARTAVADTIEELEYLPDEWGYPGPRARRLLETVNRNGADVTPSRTRDPAPLVDPPYYVIEVVPAVTFPYVGLRIDAQARVLDPQGQPIPGLLAAGADAGGIYYTHYAGGLMPAIVYGLRAAESARSAICGAGASR